MYPQKEASTNGAVRPIANRNTKKITTPIVP